MAATIESSVTGALLAFLVLSLLNSAVYYGYVVVQAGDWVEYNVTTTGNPTPIHNITWARLDVKTITGPQINTDIQTQLANGTLWLEPNTTFNVATGAVGEGVIIPTNLTVGDVYYSEYEGNITVTGTEALMVSGAERVVTSLAKLRTRASCDKETGIMSSATTTLEDCTVSLKLRSTNLCSQKHPHQTSSTLLAAGAIAALFTVILAGVLLRYKHKIKH
jgi:hypothetical protein